MTNHKVDAYSPFSAACKQISHRLGGVVIQNFSKAVFGSIVFIGFQFFCPLPVLEVNADNNFLFSVRVIQFNVFKASALWADAFYKSKCPYVCVFVCLFTFEVPFNGLFAPTSRSRMSNIFRDSESLGKSNGKKWSHI